MNTKLPWQPLEIPPDITKTGVYVGTSGYYYDDWIGIFNPPLRRTPLRVLGGVARRGTPQQEITDEEKSDRDRLRFYQKYFSFVEINNTFYSEPSLSHFLDIESRSKESMLYSVKVHKDISHTKENEIVAGQDMMRRHITAVSPLIESGRFFSFLIQLEDHVFRTQKKLDYLLAVASVAVSEHIDVHIEFRHISWHNEQVLTALKNSGVGICNTEIPHVEHAFPLKAYATTDKGYIRYSGLNRANWYPQPGQKSAAASAKERIAQRNARYDYEYSDEELLERVKGQLLLHTKTTRMAIAFNNHFNAKAIRNAMKNMRMLLERLDAAEKE
jgi:uncharacterized protein YecE (DUF72 family)